MKRSLVLLAVAALALASVAVAQPAPPPRGAAALANYLQLTPDQIAAWKQIHTETAATVQPLAQNARDLQKQLHAAVTAATPDATAVGQLTLSLHSVREQIRAAREASQTKLRAVLTDAQKAKYDAFIAATQFLRRRR